MDAAVAPQSTIVSVPGVPLRLMVSALNSAFDFLIRQILPVPVLAGRVIVKAPPLVSQRIISSL